MAVYDSSSHSDARRKLYQPSGNELAQPQPFETSPVVSDKVEQEQDEDVIEVVSTFALPLALRTMHRSVSFDNLTRLKSQRAEATSASRTTVAGALRRSRSCSSIGSGSRIRSQSLTTPVLTESCVRRIFRNNSMDKLKALGLSRGKTTPATTPEVPSPTDGMQNPREILAGLDEVLCVPGPYIELRDESQPTGRRSQSLFGALSKAVSRDVLSRLLAWSTVLTFTVLLASATAPAPDTATCSLA